MQSTLNFVTPGEDGRVKFILDYGWTGTQQRSAKIELHDVRAQAADFSLDREGFILTRLECPALDYSDIAQIESTWKPAVERTVLRHTGGNWAVLFAGPNIRYSEAHENSRGTSIAAPARAVHSDLPGNFAYGLMSRQPVAEQAMHTLAQRLGHKEPKRWRIFNYWQMLSPPPQDCTLCLCDNTTLAVEDIVEGCGFFDDSAKERSEILAREADGADFRITFVRENPAQKWCYFPTMEPGEALVFSTFDPAAGPGFRRTAHGAADVPDAGATAVPRNSIEIRALVVFDDE
ncbi:MAG: hypothetical protein H6978_08290 [Gammaproteobacteria bacterium]|nr:hypothetical protein [Gammaproteobacteria bacterium]